MRKPPPSDSSPKPIHPLIPPGLAPVFEERPLLGVETASEYDSLLCLFIDDLKPTGPVELLWAKDVVDHYWDYLRLRRMRNALIRSRYAEACWQHMTLIETREGETDGECINRIETTIEDALAGIPSAAEALRVLLDEHNTDPDHILFEARALVADGIDVIENELARIERRRDDLLVQYAGWQALLRLRARAAIERIEHLIEVDATISGATGSNTAVDAAPTIDMPAKAAASSSVAGPQ